MTRKQRNCIHFIERALGLKYDGNESVHAASAFIAQHIIAARLAACEKDLQELQRARTAARPATFRLSGRRVPGSDRADCVREYAQNRYPMGTMDFTMPVSRNHSDT